MGGGNRPGGVQPMSTGPDHRPPGRFQFFDSFFYCLNLGGGGGGGGGGWFSNLFPGGAGGFGGFGGTPGGGDARRRQPPPPGFRTDGAFDDASELDGLFKLQVSDVFTI